MSNTIRKPDADPTIAVLLCFLLLSGHVITNGQQRKWVFNVIAYFLGLIACCVPGIVVAVLSMMDAYKTAERLKAGEEIGENEYSEPMLYKIVSVLDKTATCSRV